MMSHHLTHLEVETKVFFAIRNLNDHDHDHGHDRQRPRPRPAHGAPKTEPKDETQQLSIPLIGFALKKLREVACDIHIIWEFCVY